VSQAVVIATGVRSNGGASPRLRCRGFGGWCVLDPV